MALLLQISSGRGPIECCKFVALLAESLCADARSKGIATEIIEQEAGPQKDTLLSALIHLEGEGLQEFCSSYLGTVQWINTSSYRPGHRRKNWFVGVHLVDLPKPITIAD